MALAILPQGAVILVCFSGRIVVVSRASLQLHFDLRGRVSALFHLSRSHFFFLFHFGVPKSRPTWLLLLSVLEREACSFKANFAANPIIAYECFFDFSPEFRASLLSRTTLLAFRHVLWNGIDVSIVRFLFCSALGAGLFPFICTQFIGIVSSWNCFQRLSECISIASFAKKLWIRSNTKIDNVLFPAISRVGSDVFRHAFR